MLTVIFHPQTEAAKAEHLRRVCECGEPCPSPDPSKCSLCHNAGICAKDPKGCSLCKEAAEKVRARTQALWLLPHLLSRICSSPLQCPNLRRLPPRPPPRRQKKCVRHRVQFITHLHRTHLNNPFRRRPPPPLPRRRRSLPNIAKSVLEKKERCGPNTTQR